MGACCHHSWANTQSVTIQNTGTEPLHISNITFDNEDFSVAEPQLTIAAGDSKSLPIAYAPVQYAWSLTAHMTIESDAINGKKEVTLTAIPYSVNELHLGEASGICDEIVEVPITSTIWSRWWVCNSILRCPMS